MAADTEDLVKKQTNYATLCIKLEVSEKQNQDYSLRARELEDLLVEKQARIDLLDNELQLKNEISGLQMDEFERMRESNQQLSELLQSLQTKFAGLGRAGERYERTGRDIDDKKLLAKAAVKDVKAGQK